MSFADARGAQLDPDELAVPPGQDMLTITAAIAADEYLTTDERRRLMWLVFDALAGEAPKPGTGMFR